jgi:HEAT repeat protein
MSLRLGKTNLAFFLAPALVVGAICQDTGPKTTMGGPAASPGELLRQHHVELTEAGLMRALQSPQERVRDLAAAKLAENKDVSAAPAIADALAREKSPGTQINIAFSLAQLAPDKGVAELRRDCRRQDLPGYLRARAVTYLLDLGNETCFKAALDILSADPDSRPEMLSLLPRFRHQEAQDLVEAAAACLTDSSAATRLQAGITLATLGSPSGIPYLQGAADSEQDEAVRVQMQSNLAVLKAKQQR